MRKLFLILPTVVLTANVFAQSPEKIRSGLAIHQRMVRLAYSVILYLL